MSFLTLRGIDDAPPKDRKALYQQITKERFGVLGTAKIVGKSLLRAKI